MGITSKGIANCIAIHINAKTSDHLGASGATEPGISRKKRWNAHSFRSAEEQTKEEIRYLPEMSGAFEAWLHPRHGNMPKFSELARNSVNF